MNWFSTTRWYCPLRGVESYFHSSAGSTTRLQGKPLRLCYGVIPLIHVLAWRFAQGIQFSETATFLRQIASDVMSHAQTPAKQLFWGMHGLILETSIWLLAESTRSQLSTRKSRKVEDQNLIFDVDLFLQTNKWMFDVKKISFFFSSNTKKREISFLRRSDRSFACFDPYRTVWKLLLQNGRKNP